MLQIADENLPTIFEERPLRIVVQEQGQRSSLDDEFDLGQAPVISR